MISGVNQSGRRLVLTSFLSIGACLSSFFMMMEYQFEKSSSTLGRVAVNKVMSCSRSFKKIDSLKCLKQR